MSVGGFLPWVKQLRHEADHWPLSSAEAKNECNCNSTSSVCFHSMQPCDLSFLNFHLLIVHSYLQVTSEIGYRNDVQQGDPGSESQKG